MNLPSYCGYHDVQTKNNKAIIQNAIRWTKQLNPNLQGSKEVCWRENASAA